MFFKFYFFRGVAQLVAYYVRDVGAGSSSLLTPTKNRMRVLAGANTLILFFLTLTLTLSLSGIETVRMIEKDQLNDWVKRLKRIRSCKLRKKYRNSKAGPGKDLSNRSNRSKSYIEFRAL